MIIRRKLAALVVALVAGVAGVVGIVPAAPAFATACPAGCYSYAGASQVFASPGVDGFSVIMEDIDSPNLSLTNDAHDIFELSAQNPAGDIVEVGYGPDPHRFGDKKPRIFISCWHNGVFIGYDSGCTGYTDYAPYAINTGQDVSALSPSWVNGGTKTLGIQHLGSAWWLFFGTGGTSAWLGSIPDSTFGGSFTKMRVGQAFGEVASLITAPPVGSCADMGNAANPNVSYASSRKVTNWTNLGTGAPAASLTMVEPDPSRWGAEPDPTLTNKFGFGGAGYPGTC